MKAQLLLLALAVALCGCQIPQTQTSSSYRSSPPDFTVPDEVAKSAQYLPKPSDFRAEVKRYLRLRLKDPESAIYENWTLGRAYLGSNPPVYGWLSSVSVNAKNSYGGYTGFEHYNFWHDGGRVQPALGLPYRVHLVDLVEIGDLDVEKMLKK